MIKIHYCLAAGTSHKATELELWGVANGQYRVCGVSSLFLIKDILQEAKKNSECYLPVKFNTDCST